MDTVGGAGGSLSSDTFSGGGPGVGFWSEIGDAAFFAEGTPEYDTVMGAQSNPRTGDNAILGILPNVRMRTGSFSWKPWDDDIVDLLLAASPGDSDRHSLDINSNTRNYSRNNT